MPDQDDRPFGEFDSASGLRRSGADPGWGAQQYGADRGTAIDRRFMEILVDRHREGITGTVLEVENAFYTRAFGTNVDTRIVIGISPGEHIALISDLVDLKEIASETVDCVVLTQTLQFV